LIKKWRSSINARMIFVLLAALAVGVACYFGIDALGTAAIDRWYLSEICPLFFLILLLSNLPIVSPRL